MKLDMRALKMCKFLHTFSLGIKKFTPTGPFCRGVVNAVSYFWCLAKLVLQSWSRHYFFGSGALNPLFPGIFFGLFRSFFLVRFRIPGYTSLAELEPFSFCRWLRIQPNFSSVDVFLSLFYYF